MTARIKIENGIYVYDEKDHEMGRIQKRMGLGTYGRYVKRFGIGVVLGGMFTAFDIKKVKDKLQKNKDISLRGIPSQTVMCLILCMVVVFTWGIYWFESRLLRSHYLYNSPERNKELRSKYISSRRILVEDQSPMYKYEILITGEADFQVKSRSTLKEEVLYDTVVERNSNRYKAEKEMEDVISQLGIHFLRKAQLKVMITGKPKIPKNIIYLGTTLVYLSNKITYSTLSGVLQLLAGAVVGIGSITLLMDRLKESIKDEFVVKKKSSLYQ